MGTKPSNVVIPTGEQETIPGIDLQNPTRFSFTQAPGLSPFLQDIENAQFTNRSVSLAQDPVVPASIPGSRTTGTVPSRESSPQQQTPQPLQQPQQQTPGTGSRDVMAEIRERTWAWNGVKRDLAKWAAENEGKSMTKGDVAISSSTKNAGGVDAQPGYHFITFKQGANTIELLVHDASGDIRWDGVTVNGAKVKDFSPEIGQTLGKLKGMIDSMKTPAAPSPQNNPGNNPANNSNPPSNPAGSPATENPAVTKLKEQYLGNPQVMTSILAEVQKNNLDALADIASKVSSNSKPEEKGLAMMITQYAARLSYSQVLEGASFSKLGPDVKMALEKLNDLPTERKKAYFSQWLNSMDDYLRISRDGHIVIEDDNGKQFMLGEKGGVVPVPKKLDGLMRIPDSEFGRVVSFLAVRAMITGNYYPAEISGFFSQSR